MISHGVIDIATFNMNKCKLSLNDLFVASFYTQYGINDRTDDKIKSKRFHDIDHEQEKSEDLIISTLAKKAYRERQKAYDHSIPARLPKISVLVVEDNEANIEIIKLFLSETPFDLTIAYNGKEAVNHYYKSTFDLILMDMQMPVMNGIEATKIIRKYEVDNMISPIPILSLTANTMKMDIDNYIGIGCNSVITKPVTKFNLLKEILDHIPEKAAYKFRKH